MGIPVEKHIIKNFIINAALSTEAALQLPEFIKNV